MEATLATKLEEKRSLHSGLNTVPEAQRAPEEDAGASAGMPLFLQRFAISNAALLPLQLQPEEEEEDEELELAESGVIQRQEEAAAAAAAAEEEEEEEEALTAVPVQAKLGQAGSGIVQRQKIEEEEEDLQPVAAPEEEEEEAIPESPAVQTKLTVNASNDEFEQEADRVAETVMRMPEPGWSNAADRTADGRYSTIQRDCMECEQEEEEQERLSRKPIQTIPSYVSSTSVPPPARISGTPSDLGSPLADSVRSKVESVLGADLAGVRVHDNPSSHTASRALHAKAFTHGNHIWLGANQSPADLELIAHEAAHVVQQTSGPAPVQTLQRKDPNCGDLEDSGNLRRKTRREIEDEIRVSEAEAAVALAEPPTGEGRLAIPSRISNAVLQHSGIGVRRNRAIKPLGGCGQWNVGEGVHKSRKASRHPIVQLKKIDHRRLTWNDFKRKRPPRSIYDASTATGFKVPNLRGVVPKAQHLKAVDTERECKKTTEFKVNIEIDPAKIIVKPYMWQEKSWAKSWVRSMKAREKKCKGLVKRCQAYFKKMYRKIDKSRRRHVRMCRKNYAKRLKQAKRECWKLAKQCKKFFDRGRTRYQMVIDSEKIEATTKRQCVTKLFKKCRDRLMKDWHYTITLDGDKARATTKKECSTGFSSRFEELKRSKLEWRGEVAGQSAKATSKAACREGFLQQCKDRLLQKASEALLEHEQTHFDITKVKADEAQVRLRKLAEGFDKEVTGCGKKRALVKAKRILRRNKRALMREYKARVKDRKDTQKAYDKETKHGKKQVEQAMWVIKTREKLQGR